MRYPLSVAFATEGDRHELAARSLRSSSFSLVRAWRSPRTIRRPIVARLASDVQSLPAADQRNLASGFAEILRGRKIFRFDTFGDEAFWGDTLGLHARSPARRTAASARA